MTAYEKVISNLNGNLDDDSKKQDIAQALLCPETTEEEITNLFSIFWIARFIDFELLKENTKGTVPVVIYTLYQNIGFEY